MSTQESFKPTVFATESFQKASREQGIAMSVTPNSVVLGDLALQCGLLPLAGMTGPHHNALNLVFYEPIDGKTGLPVVALPFGESQQSRVEVHPLSGGTLVIPGSRHNNDPRIYVDVPCRPELLASPAQTAGRILERMRQHPDNPARHRERIQDQKAIWYSIIGAGFVLAASPVTIAVAETSETIPEQAAGLSPGILALYALYAAARHLTRRRRQQHRDGRYLDGLDWNRMPPLFIENDKTQPQTEAS